MRGDDTGFVCVGGQTVETRYFASIGRWTLDFGRWNVETRYFASIGRWTFECRDAILRVYSSIKTRGIASLHLGVDAKYRVSTKFVLPPKNPCKFAPTALALANLKGMPKLRQSSETETHEKNTTDLFIDSIFEQCPTACSNDPTLF